MSNVSLQLQKDILHREFWIRLFIGRIFPLLIPLLVWRAIFLAGDIESIGLWNIETMTGYYILVLILMLFAATNFHVQFSQYIHSGSLNQWLIRPVHFFNVAAGIIIARVLILIIPALSIFILAQILIPNNDLSLETLVNAIPVLPLSIIILSLLSVCVGFLAFWVTHTESTFSIIMIVLEFFGGKLLPLDLFPPWLKLIGRFLPLQYAVSLPVTYALKPDVELLTQVLLGQLGWCTILACACALLWSMGLRRYDAVGG